MLEKREIIDVENDADVIEYDDELAEQNLKDHDWSDKITDGIGGEQDE